MTDLSNDGIASPWRCRAPWLREAVQATLGKDDLSIVAEKHTRAYSAWLWQDERGRGFYSKQPANGRGFCWTPDDAPVELILKRNPSLRRVEQASPPTEFSI